MMKCKQLFPDEWARISEQAHSLMFNKIREADMDRIHFVLITENEEGAPVAYNTFRELDAESVYGQFGGVFPAFRGKKLSVESQQAVVDWIRQAGFKRIICLVENTNMRYMQVLLKLGFLINGTRFFKGTVLVELLKELEGIELGNQPATNERATVC